MAKTLEQIQAELETLKRQFTDFSAVSPVSYYVHQYSGEEIDAAVGAVPTLVRPNLLDNWYFGNPVDQKGGMLQLAGTMLYSDAACTQNLYPSTKTTSIIKVSDIAAHPSDNSTVYVKLADCVRGYTGTHTYTVDRWLTDNTMTIVDGGVKVKRTGHDVLFYQYFDKSLIDAIAGKVVTYSALTTSGLMTLTTEMPPISSNWDTDNVFQGNLVFDIYKGNSLQAYIRLYSLVEGTESTIIAVKLELGSTQTLAHQENGQWVLNEIPEEGEQLRRCQRYALKIGDAVRYCSLGNGVARDGQFVSITIPTPVTMRTIPSLIAPPVGFTMRHSDTIISGGANFNVDAFSQNSILLKVQSQVALTPGDMWEAFLQPNGSIMFSADL